MKNIIIVVAILALAVTAYTVGQSLKPTAMQVYENSDLGLTLNLPAGWQAVPSAEGSAKGFELNGGKEGHVRLFVVNIPMNQELEAYLFEKDRLAQTGFEGQPSSSVKSSNRISVGGLLAVEREEDWYAAGFSNILVTYLKRGDKILTIHQLPVGDDGKVNSTEKAIYREIVSSIKFDSAVSSSNDNSKTGDNPDKTILTLHFQDRAGVAQDCAATYEVKREIAKTPRVADTALRILLDESLPNLAPFYKSVTVSSGVATVDFSEGALRYLNSAACEQSSYKSPIEKTLKEFPTVQSVQYSIDGKVYTEWDA